LIVVFSLLKYLVVILKDGLIHASWF